MAESQAKTGPRGSSRVERRPLRRRMQARLMRIVNVPMRIILRVPFPTPLTKRLMLAYLTGRKTGKKYRQPLSYVPHEGTLLTPGGGRWKLNLNEDGYERLRMGGTIVEARPELVADIDEVDRLLEVMVAVNPGVRAFGGFGPDPEGGVDRKKLETAVQYGFRVVRWHLRDTDDHGEQP